MIWNNEGFKDPRKHLFVTESISDHCLDFIALLETGRSNFALPFLRGLANDKDFSWFCLPLRGRSGGILIALRLPNFR
jgi:hypothetical protein